MALLTTLATVIGPIQRYQSLRDVERRKTAALTAIDPCKTQPASIVITAHIGETFSSGGLHGTGTTISQTYGRKNFIRRLREFLGWPGQALWIQDTINEFRACCKVSLVNRFKGICFVHI